MSRRVVITGLGPVTGLGLGIEPNWARAIAGTSAIEPIQAFDPAGFDCRIAAEVEPFKIRDFVPKTYRKATKVMARDIELAVVAADMAARDAKLSTPSTDDQAQPSYASDRVGCHIGAGLIAGEIDELTAALHQARHDDGSFDMHKWGQEGINHLTPLWLLKYLPNMLACHVTILHGTQGPSNTITCGESSSGLSIGESLRVIQRSSADLCFCGGVESKLNPMAFLRQQLTERLNTTANDDPGQAVRPFDQNAAGMAIGEGGGIVVLEALETYQQRSGARAYAEVLSFAASQTFHRATKNRTPDPAGQAIGAAITHALNEANLTPDDIDLIAPFGIGHRDWDGPEAVALQRIFGDRLANVAITGNKALAGNCGAGAGAVDLAFTAQALYTQTLPAILNRDHPIPGLRAGGASTQANLQHALVCATGFGGQNTAIILKRLEA